MKKLILMMMLMMPLAGWAQSGPADVLVGIFGSYREKMAAAESEEAYKSLTSEMLAEIGELEKKYPDYEPSDADMERISAAMRAYTDQDEELREKFGVLTPEEEEEAKNSEAVDAIVTHLQEIESMDLRVLTMLKYYTEKIEAVTNENEFLEVVTEMEAVSSQIAPDGYEPSEENKEELQAASGKLGEVVGKKIRELQ